MGYKLSWLLENRILLISYDGVLTKADLQTYLAESMDMRDRANAILGVNGPLVHTITDASKMTKQELTLADASHVVNTLRNQRVGWSIYIPANKVDGFMANIGHQLAKVRYRQATDIATAVDFLKDIDPTLAEFQYMPHRFAPPRSP